eukprot:2774552-Amphidinium_carterae.1
MGHTVSENDCWWKGQGKGQGNGNGKCKEKGKGKSNEFGKSNEGTGKDKVHTQVCFRVESLDIERGTADENMLMAGT